MEQPNFLNNSSPEQQQQPNPNNNSTIITNTNTNTNTKTQKQKANIPTPQELLRHYETKGMSREEASIKVIDDLQGVLFRVVTSKKGRKDKFIGEASKKLDNVNARLAIVEKKLDTKPGLAEGFAIGVASATAVRGAVAVWPNVVAALFGVWESVRGVANNNNKT